MKGNKEQGHDDIALQKCTFVHLRPTCSRNLHLEIINGAVRFSYTSTGSLKPYNHMATALDAKDNKQILSCLDVDV